MLGINSCSDPACTMMVYCPFENINPDVVPSLHEFGLVCEGMHICFVLIDYRLFVFNRHCLKKINFFFLSPVWFVYQNCSAVIWDFPLKSQLANYFPKSPLSTIKTYLVLNKWNFFLKLVVFNELYDTHLLFTTLLSHQIHLAQF